MIRAKILSDYPKLKHGFLNRRETVAVSNEKRINRAFSCQQVHGRQIAVADGRKYYGNYDGIIANNRAAIFIKTADCLPVFFYSPQNNTVAAVHAGWRGLQKGIIKNTIEKLRRQGIYPGSLLVAIGPHICFDCYRVGPDLIDMFAKIIPGNGFFRMQKGVYYLDIASIAKKQLFTEGIKESAYENVGVCTYTDDGYASYRRTGSMERNYSIIELR